MRFSYTVDGLGRLRDYRQPGGNGVGVVYDGLTRTIREATVDGSGGVRRLREDAFGRLVKWPKAARQIGCHTLSLRCAR